MFDFDVGAMFDPNDALTLLKICRALAQYAKAPAAVATGACKCRHRRADPPVAYSLSDD